MIQVNEMPTDKDFVMIWRWGDTTMWRMNSNPLI